jgi:pimeloyl-ACP methyl ester carboxylesterase
MSSTSVPMSDAAPPPRPARRWKRLLKRTVQALAGGVILLACVGAAYEFVAERMDARHFPQRGRSIQLGPEFQNISLNLDCSGRDPPAGLVGQNALPTVILDSGLGVPAIGWKLVQDQVAKFTRVCSYDRAGYSWSDSGPLPRTSLQITRELHALLTTAGEKGPFVLVGHSFGGLNVRVYTGQYPHEVVGMVLVDAMHEDQYQKFPAPFRRFQPPSDTQLMITDVLLHLGIARALQGNSGGSNSSNEFMQQVAAAQWSAKFNTANTEEIRAFAQSAEQVRAAGNLGDRPLIVLTAGKALPASVLPEGATPKDLEELHRVWVDELQISEMHLSTRGKRIIVTDSGHLIPFERPDAIVAAIHEVCDVANQRSR